VKCFGVEATAKTQELIDTASGHFLLEKDVGETDKYGPLLHYVWLIHPDRQRMLNKELFKGGYARVSTYPSDVKYQDLFLAAQVQAGTAGAGLWGECGTFRVPAASEQPAPPPADSASSTSTPASRGSSFNTAGDKDCKEFATHADLQAYFTGRGGLPSNSVDGLDNHHDGTAFESRP
jgi:micrococcal nuclease